MGGWRDKWMMDGYTDGSQNIQEAGSVANLSFNRSE